MGVGGGPQTLTTGCFPGSVARMQGLRGKPTCLQGSKHLGELLGTQGRYLPKRRCRTHKAFFKRRSRRSGSVGSSLSLASWCPGSRIQAGGEGPADQCSPRLMTGWQACRA